MHTHFLENLKDRDHVGELYVVGMIKVKLTVV